MPSKANSSDPELSRQQNMPQIFFVDPMSPSFEKFGFSPNLVQNSFVQLIIGSKSSNYCQITKFILLVSSPKFRSTGSSRAVQPYAAY